MAVDFEHRSAEEVVFQRLRREILAGSIKAGAPINQAEVAASLKISRIPVRAALQRLLAAGLLVALPNRRLVVPTFTASEIEELFEIRARLEGFAASRAVECLTESDLSELEMLAEFMERPTDLDGYTKWHDAFHNLVLQRSQLPRVASEVTQLREMLAPYIRIYGAAVKSLEMPRETHCALVEALRTGDPAVADAAFVNHVRSAKENLVAAVKRLTVANADDGSRTDGARYVGNEKGSETETVLPLGGV